MLARGNNCPLLDHGFIINIPLAGMQCTKRHETCTMSTEYPLAIEHCLFSSDKSL